MPICPTCNATYQNDAPLCPKCTVTERQASEHREKRLKDLENIFWMVLCAPGILALIRRTTGASPYPLLLSIFQLSLIVIGVGGVIGIAIYRRRWKK